MPPHVPQDIWNAVIESIDPDDVLSLRSCALVHPDWTPISRLCLARHRHISITGMDGYEQVLNRFLRSESMRPWLGGVKSLSFNPEFADWDDKRGYRFFHDFAGRLPNLRYLIIDCADWTVAPHHPSTFRMFSQFPSVTYLEMYQTEFPSFNDFRRALSSLPSLSTLVLYNWNYRWFPLPHHELWQNASPQKRPVLRVFRIRFDLTQEELDVLFHWLLQTPSRLSIRDLAFSTLHLHKGPLRQPCIDFVDTVAPSVSTLRIDCREAISLRNFLDLHSLPVDVVPGGWEQLKGLLCDLPSRIRCLQLKSIPVLVLPAAGTLDHVLYDTDFFTEAHRHGVSQLDACLSLDSLSELQTLELVLSVQELRNHLRQEFESSHPYDDRTYWISLLERFTEPSEEYLLLVIEDSIEDDIRNGLTSLRTPGREVEIVMTAHTACILERSPWYKTVSSQ